MDWIELYVGEVARHVPPKRREDVAISIREEIESLLPPQPNENDVKRVIEEMGDPAIVAARYKEGQYLIGPTYFTAYISVIKIVLPIMMAVLLLSLLIANISTLAEANIPTIGALLVTLFDTLWNVGIQLLFWITLIFFLVERYGPKESSAPKMNWNISKLKNWENEVRISKFEAGFGLFWTAILLGVYLNAERLVGVYESTDGGLRMVAPVFNQSFLFDMLWLFLIVIAFQIILGTWKWIRGYWTFALASFNFLYNVISVVFVIWMVRSPNLLDARFKDWMEQNVPGDVSFEWAAGVFIAFVIFIATLDTISQFRKAYKSGTPRKHKVAHT